jgi:hypothetical protein
MSGWTSNNQGMRPFDVYPGGAGSATNGSDHKHSIAHPIRRYLKLLLLNAQIVAALLLR